MAYQGSKGWYVQELKKLGISKHPVEHRKIELYKTYVIRNLYVQYTSESK
ncbi:MAG TPA: YflJ family protein [Pseudoneobacillus sp.]|nr:YflJ family protein [Pseudoneobacillus sp.]